MNLALTQQGYESLLWWLTVVNLVALLGSLSLANLAITSLKTKQQSPVDCPKCAVNRPVPHSYSPRNYRCETTSESLSRIRRSPLADVRARNDQPATRMRRR
jgi:hypothetical protein